MRFIVPPCARVAGRRPPGRGIERQTDITSNSNTGTYRRLTGVLRLAGHSPMLETGDDRILRLVTSDDLRDFDGEPVIVEGNLTGPDRIQVEWIRRPNP